MPAKLYLFKKQRNFNPTKICASTVYIYCIYFLKIYISITNFEALKVKTLDFKEDHNEAVIVRPPSPTKKKKFFHYCYIVNENFLSKLNSLINSYMS